MRISIYTYIYIYIYEKIQINSTVCTHEIGKNNFWKMYLFIYLCMIIY